MTVIYNKSDFTDRRRQLRNESPSSEQLLWCRLRRKQLHGLKFRRQYGIGPYVADLYCPAVKLAIEIDGDSHNSGDAREYDAERTQFMESMGTTILRFTNDRVRNEIDTVVQEIAATALHLPRVLEAM